MEVNFFTILWWFYFTTKIRQNLNNLMAERTFFLPEPRWELLFHHFQLSALFTVFYEKAMATHSSTLAWKIPWPEEPGRLQSIRSLGVGHDWAASLSIFTFHFYALEKEMATHSSILAWRFPGTGEPGGLPSMGSHRVWQGWSDLSAASWVIASLSWKSRLIRQ